MKRRIVESDGEEDNGAHHALLKFIADESVDVFVQSNLNEDLNELNGDGDSGTSNNIFPLTSQRQKRKVLLHAA